MNSDVHYHPATLECKNGEQLEDFHSRTLILQQEIDLYAETTPPKRLLFQYTKVLSKSDKLKAFIVPKMTDIIIFLNNNGNLAIYIVETFMEYIVI